MLNGRAPEYLNGVAAGTPTSADAFDGSTDRLAPPSGRPLISDPVVDAELDRLVEELAEVRNQLAVTRARRRAVEDEMRAALRREVEASRARLSDIEDRHRRAVDRIREEAAATVASVTSGGPALESTP